MMTIDNEVVYFQFTGILKGEIPVIRTADINQQTWQEYYDGISNLMKDYIETELVQNRYAIVDFGDESIELYLVDLYFNIIMWHPLIQLGAAIEPKHLFFVDELTQDSIKDYFDTHIIEVYRRTVESIVLNNVLDDAVYNLLCTDAFSMYLANTINLKDTLDLMNANEEANNILHLSLKNRPMEEVKDIGMQYTHRFIELIKDSKKYIGYDHCLANSFRAHEGVNIRQFKEFAINIGSKPNGYGGVHTNIIDGSYLSGALNNLESQFIDSAASRVAQIQTKQNTGDSGSFARVLGLNNIDTFLYPDPDYDCHTENFLYIQIKNKKYLTKLRDMYYKLNPNGVDYRIHPKDTHLIGQWIYLRSPITCASNARGHGVCQKCCGELWYTLRKLKPGKYAAEKLSSEITQRQLSAKHLLETKIKALRWFTGFSEYFNINMNIIQLNPLKEVEKGTFLIINPDDIVQVNSDDFEKSDYADGGNFDSEYNDYILQCRIRTQDEEEDIIIATKDNDRLYISDELKKFIADKDINNAVILEDDLIYIDLFKLYKLNNGQDFSCFLIDLNNDELNKVLDDITNMIDLKSVVAAQTKESIFTNMLDLIIEAGLSISGLHVAMIISSQIRDGEAILEKPDWSIPNASYQVIPLKSSLANNPSIVVTLLFEDLGKTLYAPISFQKKAPSIMDLFCMSQPQNFLSDTSNLVELDGPKSDKIKVFTQYKVQK